jgi:hypothetical protein
MRQHVFAFLVALVVWMAISLVNATVAVREARAQTGGVSLRCEHVFVPEGNAEKRCLPPSCGGNCRGRGVLQGQCINAPAPPNTICVEFTNLYSPVYYIYSSGCVYYQGMCFCTDEWQLGEQTGETRIVPDCRQADGGSGGGS